MNSNEFRITDQSLTSTDESADAALHEPLLANRKAQVYSDLMAVESMVRSGISIEDAANACAGPGARAALIRSGQLKA